MEQEPSDGTKNKNKHFGFEICFGTLIKSKVDPNIADSDKWEYGKEKIEVSIIIYCAINIKLKKEL